MKTDDRELAKRRLQEEIDQAAKVDLSKSKLTLSELLRLYEERIAQYAPKTTATRQCITNIFKETWPHGLDVPIKSVSPGQLELWLGTRRAQIRNSTYNGYARFVRHLFELAVKLRALPDSPARGIKGLKVETPIRLTPTWEQFQKIVESVRSQKFSDTGDDSADLVEFMGLAGVGTAECANRHGEHISFPGNRITLYRKKTDTGYAIPIFPQVLPLLKRLDSNGQIAAGQPVFRVKDPKKALAAACKRLGLPNFSPRSLRRCFITRAIELGVDFTPRRPGRLCTVAASSLPRCRRALLPACLWWRCMTRGLICGHAKPICRQRGELWPAARPMDGFTSWVDRVGALRSQRWKSTIL